jgi:SAM-dependent methyltransferase
MAAAAGEPQGRRCEVIAGRKREWFDDESFWRDLSAFLFPETRCAAAELEVDQVLALTMPRGKMALDLCCGPGRCAIALAKRRFSVTGVDRTRYLLKKAEARAKAARVKIEWIRRDMRDFVRPDSFDLVLSMFTSFGYFDDKQDDLRVLSNILACLRPGGSFLIDVVGKEHLANILTPTTSEELADGSRLIQCHEIFDDWTRIRNKWILVRHGRAKSFEFHHTIYSGQELRDRMERVGFIDVNLFGSLSGDEYGPKAQRLIAVGYKPGRE